MKHPKDKTVSFKMPEDIHLQVLMYIKENGITWQELLDEALKQYFKKNNVKPVQPKTLYQMFGD